MQSVRVSPVNWRSLEGVEGCTLVYPDRLRYDAGTMIGHNSGKRRYSSLNETALDPGRLTRV